VGDAPQLGAYICCPPTAYVLFRMLTACTVICIMTLRLIYAFDGVSWLLYFNHWVTILAAFYFTLAAFLSFAAVFTDGRATSGPPFPVTVCNIAYGMLVPAAAVSALASGLVFYDYNTLFEDATKGITDVGTTFGICALVWADLVVNRQPYYASFHALLGCLTCWGYIAFTVAYYFTHGTDSIGHPYIYPQLSWAVPLRGGGSVTGGKLLAMNIFLLAPTFNYMYWFLVWARRRVILSSKPENMAV